MIKKLVILFFTASFAIKAQAQVAPTYDFEGWTPLGSYDDPNGWVTLNALTNPLFGSNPATVFRESTNPHGGTYCMRITSVALTNNPSPADIPDTVGLAVTGSIVFTPTVAIRPGTPYTARPAQAAAYMRYAPTAVGDSGFLYFALTKWNGTSTDTIGIAGAVISTTVSNWQLYTMPFIYNPAFSNVQPDSMIVFCSATDDDFPHPGSSIYVDDITFSGWVGIDESTPLNEFAMYPNPASDFISLRVDQSAQELVVFNLEGREVAHYPIENGTLRVDVSTLPVGIYTCTLLNEQKLAIGRSKFTINR